MIRGALPRHFGDNSGVAEDLSSLVSLVGGDRLSGRSVGVAHDLIESNYSDPSEMIG